MTLTDSSMEGTIDVSTRRVDWTKPRVAAILTAAAKCFARSGFGTTTAEIAKELSVPKSIIYHYFDNKDALIREVQRFTYKQHLERVREVLAQASGATGREVFGTLRALWKARNLRNIAFDIGVWSALRTDEIVRQQAIELQREHRRIVSENVARALSIDADDPERTEPLTTLILAALTGLSINAFVEGDETEAEKAHELFMQLLEAGIEQFTRRDSEIPPSGEFLTDAQPFESEREQIVPSAPANA